MRAPSVSGSITSFGEASASGRVALCFVDGGVPAGALPARDEVGEEPGTSGGWLNKRVDSSSECRRRTCGGGPLASNLEGSKERLWAHT